jgi:hypothetical protein
VNAFVLRLASGTRGNLPGSEILQVSHGHDCLARWLAALAISAVCCAAACGSSPAPQPEPPDVGGPDGFLVEAPDAGSGESDSSRFECVDGQAECIDSHDQQECVDGYWQQRECDFRCESGRCVEPGCDESVCSDDSRWLLQCTSPSVWTAIPCEGGRCLDGACVDNCNAGALRCSGGGAVADCDGNVVEVCSPAEVCVDAECVPGEFRLGCADEQTIEVLDAFGTPLDSIDCPLGTECELGACVDESPRVCRRTIVLSQAAHGCSV